MDVEEQRFEIERQGLVIEILCTPDWIRGFREIYGYSMTKVEVRSMLPEGTPLPVTETGYIVRYIRSDDLEGERGPVQFVLAWLEHESHSPESKEQEAKRGQYSLF